VVQNLLKVEKGKWGQEKPKNPSMLSEDFKIFKESPVKELKQTEEREKIERQMLAARSKMTKRLPITGERSKEK